MSLSDIPKDKSDFITVDQLIEALTKLRAEHNCGSLPVALSHWEDFDMAEIHKSGVITRVSTTDGPKVLYGRSMSNSMECIMLDFELFPEQNYV
ncbi:MAG: hypothetical protein J6Q22_16800 [Prevotella sp.]|nr:hypothetical protein [Prevotella sp.]